MSKLIQDHIDRWGRDRRDLYPLQIFNLHQRVNKATPIEREEYWHFANGKLFSPDVAYHRRCNLNGLDLKHPKIPVVRNHELDTKPVQLVNGWVEMDQVYEDLIYFEKLVDIRRALEQLTYCQMIGEMIHYAWEHYLLIELMPIFDYGQAYAFGDKVFESVKHIAGIERIRHEGGFNEYEMRIPIELGHKDKQIVICRHYNVKNRKKSAFWTDNKDNKIDFQKAFDMLRSQDVTVVRP